MTIDLKSYVERSGFLEAHVVRAGEIIEAALESMDANSDWTKRELGFQLRLIKEAMQKVDEAKAEINAELDAWRKKREVQQ